MAVTSTEPFMAATRRGTALRQTSLELTFARTNFYARILDVETASDAHNFGVCAKFPNLNYHFDESV